MNPITPSLIQNLFDFGLEEIIQQIFLYLDSKSLKNAKLTSTQWREFIDRRIWGSKYAKGQLYNELILKWKGVKQARTRFGNVLGRHDGPVRAHEPEIKSLELEELTYVVCDMQVIICSSYNGKVITFDANTCELLYSHDLSKPPPVVGNYLLLPPYGEIQMDISGEHLILVCTNKGFIKILNKVTGVEVFRDDSQIAETLFSYIINLT